MNSIIREYYEKAGVQPFLIEKKLEAFGDNKDIAADFEYWIKHGKYGDNVVIEGYSASDISQMSPYMNGEGAFMMLIELRTEPEKAMKRIKQGFKIK